MALKAKSSDTDESSNDEDSKMKSYITRQFKKFMKNANGRNFDKDRRQSSSSQFKGQDKGKKEAKEGGQYTVLAGPKCFKCQGFGHMKHEYPTYLKSIRKSKAFAATLNELSLRKIPTMRMTESRMPSLPLSILTHRFASFQPAQSKESYQYPLIPLVP